MSNFSLNEKQQTAYDLIRSGKNVFISGPGGVGKSYLVNYLKTKFDDMVLLAPTGIAALNIDGSTIHRSFGLRVNMLSTYDQQNPSPKAQELFGTESPVKRIVIDEISMVREDVLQCMDQQLRRIRRRNVPFGGLQIVVVGDFYQLPPVLTRYDKEQYYKLYESIFAFGSETWSQGNFSYIELDQIMRQSDEEFIYHLQNIRQKRDGYKDSIKFFNEISAKNGDSVLETDPVFLSTTNKSADLVNKHNYEQLQFEENVYHAKVKGEVRDDPAPRELKLKYGTKVMFTANNEEVGYFNGEVGYITNMTKEHVEVTKDNRSQDTLLIRPHKWNVFDYVVKNNELKREEVGSYEQFPLKHAWGITIHKAQGVTLDSAVIDLGRGCFTSGQLYVALSRVKELEGISLIRDIRQSDVIVDRQIQEFYANDCKGIGLF